MTITEQPRLYSRERLYTVADLAELPSELPSGPVVYELENGRLLTMSPPGDEHGAVELRLAGALLYEGEYRGHGQARCGEVSIILWRNPDRVVGANAVFIANGSLPVQRSREGYLETIPDLVLEVVSKYDSGAQIQRKVEDYLTAGVKVVWVADPGPRTITVHRPGVEPQVLAEPDVLTVEELIPGFRFPVQQAFPG